MDRLAMRQRMKNYMPRGILVASAFAEHDADLAMRMQQYWAQDADDRQHDGSASATQVA